MPHNYSIVYHPQVELQCWKDSFDSLKESGSAIAGVLIEESLVNEKVDELQTSYEDVSAKWGAQNDLLEDHKVYQCWLRDAEVVSAWLSSREQIVG